MLFWCNFTLKLILKLYKNRSQELRSLPLYQISHHPFPVLLGPRNRLRSAAGREGLWRGLGEAFLWGIWEEVQAWCEVQAQGSGQALPRVWKAEEADECQLFWPSVKHRVLHEWHRRVCTHEQVSQQHSLLVLLARVFTAYVMFLFLILGVSSKRCVSIFWPELNLLCRACWNNPVSKVSLSCWLSRSRMSLKTYFGSLFSLIRAEKGRHLCSRDSWWSFQNPSCQRKDQQILWEGVEHYAECWWSSGQRMCPAGTLHSAICSWSQPVSASVWVQCVCHQRN